MSLCSIHLCSTFGSAVAVVGGVISPQDPSKTDAFAFVGAEGYDSNGAVFVYSLVESDPSAEWVAKNYSASPLETVFQFGKAVAGANVGGVPIGVVGASGESGVHLSGVGAADCHRCFGGQCHKLEVLVFGEMF